MVLALNVSVYFCKLLPLHMNGNLPVGIGMHVFAMICDLILTVPSSCISFHSLSSWDTRSSWVNSVQRQFLFDG
eukprot:UN3850